MIPSPESRSKKIYYIVSLRPVWDTRDSTSQKRNEMMKRTTNKFFKKPGNCRTNEEARARKFLEVGEARDPERERRCDVM